MYYVKIYTEIYKDLVISLLYRSGDPGQNKILDVEVSSFEDQTSFYITRLLIGVVSRNGEVVKRK